MISCFSELFKTKTIPKTNWFWIAYSIFVTVLFHFKSINSTDPNTQTNFLSNYLPHNIVTKTSEGLFFVARPKFEDLARFLFSKHLSKWEPLSLIHPKNDQIIVDVGSNVVVSLRVDCDSTKMKCDLLAFADPPDDVLKLFKTKSCPFEEIFS